MSKEKKEVNFNKEVNKEVKKEEAEQVVKTKNKFPPLKNGLSSNRPH